MTQDEVKIITQILSSIDGILKNMDKMQKIIDGQLDINAKIIERLDMLEMLAQRSK